MKNFLLVSLASTGLIALAGCSDDTQQTTTSRSVTMSSDSKNMTGNTYTTTTEAPAETDTTVTTKTEDESDTQGYPAIHSNGQH